MLTTADIRRPTGELQEVLRRAAENFADALDAPPMLRDVAYLFELEREVNHGGFAQYLFNRSCLHAFDAWFASHTLDPGANELLGLAMLRLGAEFGVDLDLRTLVRLKTGRSDALRRAYQGLVSVYRVVHTTRGELGPFVPFRDRLAGPRRAVAGLDELDRRFYWEVRVGEAIAEYAKAHPAAFVV